VIRRVWRGWTTPANADAFERFLLQEDFGAIPGFHGMEVLRLDAPDEVEFMSIMTFDSLEAVRAFAGDSFENAVVPSEAQALLIRYDSRSKHYQARSR
jgi:heme-degrading monooxygenase HmoA